MKISKTSIIIVIVNWINLKWYELLIRIKKLIHVGFIILRNVGFASACSVRPSLEILLLSEPQLQLVKPIFFLFRVLNVNPVGPTNSFWCVTHRSNWLNVYSSTFSVFVRIRVYTVPWSSIYTNIRGQLFIKIWSSRLY